MPWSSKHWSNVLEIHSMFFSNQIVLILSSNGVFITTPNHLSISKQSPLDFNVYNYTLLKDRQWRSRKTLHCSWIWSLWGHTHRNAKSPKAWLQASPLYPYVVFLQCMLCNTTYIYGENKIPCQSPFSCKSQCFETYEHHSRFNSQGGGAKAKAHHLPLEIEPNWCICYVFIY